MSARAMCVSVIRSLHDDGHSSPRQETNQQHTFVHRMTAILLLSLSVSVASVATVVLAAVFAVFAVVAAVVDRIEIAAGGASGATFPRPARVLP